MQRPRVGRRVTRNVIKGNMGKVRDGRGQGLEDVWFHVVETVRDYRETQATEGRSYRAGTSGFEMD